MPPPTSLTAGHLAYAVVPPAPDDAADPARDPVPVLVAGLDRVDSLLRIADGARVRLTVLPEPPQQLSLTELVQAARRRLRGQRVRLDTDELAARRYVLDRVREGLVT
ncbi:hypothetical protein SAMN05444365_10627 [Micromonospora pattaloongensis]|uniref:Uncharacterized protein n=1 Tax=Micromonospora pattaloongensis TaxID=405436 RepID=A0A1H3QPF0_9ACTN|nr:hypothetical protein [Micromonospora pattaloongensis]SDZ14888.1 hypothetical protein SAMN05444365_10627 [Micromonospora pattaloongensis]